MTLKIRQLLNPAEEATGASNEGTNNHVSLAKTIAIVNEKTANLVCEFNKANIDPNLGSSDTDSDPGAATPTSSVAGSDDMDDVSIGHKRKAYMVIPGFLDPNWGKKPATDTARMVYRRGPVGNFSHVYDNSSCYMHPADPMETRRQAINHKISLTARDGRLFLSILQHNPMKMLFLGIGDGRLLFDVANRYPFTKIIAVSDELPNTIGTYVPRNVSFKVADLEEDWTAFDDHWEGSYDLVMMVSLFDTYQGDLWPLLTKAYKALQHNGCLEIHDHISPTEVTSKDLALAHRELRGALVEQLIPLTNARCMAGAKMGQSMKTAGFVDVEHAMVRVPSNPHAVAPGKPTHLLTNEQHREVMCAELVQMNAFDNKVLEKLAKNLFVKGRGWSEERAEEWITEMAYEMEHTGIFAYKPYYFTWGRKEDLEAQPKQPTGIPKIVMVPGPDPSQPAMPSLRM